MNLKLHSQDDVTIVEVVGRVDTHTVKTLSQQLQIASSQSPANIVIDLAGVSFLDSSGLSALVQGMRSCRASGGDLRLAGPSTSVQMILELTRLDKALDVFPDEAKAVASFMH